MLLIAAVAAEQGEGMAPERALTEQPCPHLTEIRVPSLGTADSEAAVPVGHPGRQGAHVASLAPPTRCQEPPVVTATAVSRHRPVFSGGRITPGGSPDFFLLLLLALSVNPGVLLVEAAPFCLVTDNQRLFSLPSKTHSCPDG